MKERNNSLSSHQKAFNKAKKQADRMAVAKLAARDEDFLPAHPESMDYSLAQHDNKGKGVLFLDVDDVLLSEVDGVALVNDELIKACHKAGYTEAYLVTSMSMKLEKDFNRVDLIAYMAMNGVMVKGLIPEADAAPEASLGDFYHDYYSSVIQGEISNEVAERQGERKKSAEAESEQYSKQQGKDSFAFGKKLMMMRKLLQANPNVKKIIFADDSIANLNGITYDYMTNPYHQAVLCMLPIVKMSSEVKKPTLAKQYEKLIEKFDQGRREIDEDYQFRMNHYLFHTQLINLDHRTLNGNKALPQFQSFRDSLAPASAKLYGKHVDVSRVIDEVYGALRADFEAYAQSFQASKGKQSTMALSAVIFDRFRELEDVLLMWHKALLPNAPKVDPVISAGIDMLSAPAAAGQHALSQQSLFAHRSHPEAGSVLKPPRKPS